MSALSGIPAQSFFQLLIVFRKDTQDLGITVILEFGLTNIHLVTILWTHGQGYSADQILRGRIKLRDTVICGSYGTVTIDVCHLYGERGPSAQEARGCNIT